MSFARQDSMKDLTMFGSGFRIGRLYGINIRVDWSWLIIVFLITWNLTTVFGQLHPEWQHALRWVLSLAAALLFFASVLAHELAHSLVARSQGIPVQNITLFLFGGVANIQREPSTPKNEFLMAIAGPVTSLILGLFMLLVAVAGAITGGGFSSPGQLITNLSPASTILLWLGSINIILAIFNMIPGFPLDGGRVLRSILWAITNNFRKATRWAAFIGQSIAWLMIAAGVAMAVGLRLPFLGTGLINGVWLAFIGWFLNGASAQSYRHIAIQEILDGVLVSQLMRKNLPSIPQDCKISDLVQTHIMGSDDQALPVLEENRLLGIVTMDDVRKVSREQWDTLTVREIMTPEARLVTAAPEEAASSAIEKLMERGVRQLPVVRPSAHGYVEFLGLLRRHDVLQWLQMQPGFPGRSQEPL
jgi:Zn-dependent protease